MFLWNELQTASRPILIYGMGNGAEKVLELCRKYGIRPAGLFASDSHARTGVFQGFPVMARSEALQKYPTALILLAFGTERPEEITELLALSRDDRLRIPDVPLLGGESLTPDNVASREDEIRRCRGLFSDAASRALFDSLLEAKLTGHPEAVMANTSLRTELLDHLNLGPQEDYLDLGAYRGDTMEEFLSLTGGNYRTMTAMEPDAHNYRKLHEAFGGFPRTTLYPYASWNVSTSLEFTGKGGRNCAKKPELPGKYTHLHPVEALPVDALSLEVSYVKMDVEGAEAETLLGMAQTIRRCRPKLLISAYHRPDDFITLPLLAAQLLPDADFYLRRTPCIPTWEIQLCVLPRK